MLSSYLSIYFEIFFINIALSADMVAGASCKHSTGQIDLQFSQARSQPSGNKGSFSSDFGPFSGLKIGVTSGCLAETSIFKIIMTGDIALWSKLESTR